MLERGLPIVAVVVDRPCGALDIAKEHGVPGELVVLNLSYRSDPAADLADAQAVSRLSGLHLERAGTSDLRSWDGRTFHFRKQRA